MPYHLKLDDPQRAVTSGYKNRKHKRFYRTFNIGR